MLERHVDAGYVPGAPMAAEAICRIGSMAKPVVSACAMTLVEDCTLRLDDPVDEFLPELADMSVLVKASVTVTPGDSGRQSLPGN